jgi:hypothetical protein
MNESSTANNVRNEGKTMSTTTANKGRLCFNFNLDDEVELDYVKNEYGILQGCRGRRLARKLGWSGRGSAKAANAVANYVWNKLTAMECRRQGAIDVALMYEGICERIYSRDLQPLVEVW